MQLCIYFLVETAFLFEFAAKFNAYLICLLLVVLVPERLGEPELAALVRLLQH